MSVADSDEDKIPKSPFAVYRTEADSLFRSSKYGMAIKCYTQALELEPENQHCLVARSRCHLYEGQNDKALEDAETSLKLDSKYPKGLYQKAEVYYIMGEFEKALILYHRGQKLRPEMEQFRLGIQKCEEAIHNSVGDPETIKLRLDCDLSYFLNDEKKNSKKQNDRLNKKKTDDSKKKQDLKPIEANQSTVKKLLGELYADREFLEKLLKEEDSFVKKTKNSDEIRELTVKELNYLHDRCDFWQQQKPMYARKKKSWSRRKSSAGSTKQQKDIIKYVVKSLNEIDMKQQNGEHKNAIKQADSLLKQIDHWKETELQDRHELMANIYCLIGNSYLEMNQFDKALKYHEKDRDFGDTYNLEESKSRSVDNLGRLYAKQGNYNKAIEVWEKKISKAQSALESTWLHHEIGRCYLELGDGKQASIYGEKAIEFAIEAEEEKWQMNAYILVAQSSSFLKEYSEAIMSFERALEISRLLGNKSAEDEIKKAIEDVNNRIIQEGKEKREENKKKDKKDKEKKSKKKKKDDEESGEENEEEEENIEDEKVDEEKEEQSEQQHDQPPAEEHPTEEPVPEESPKDEPAKETEEVPPAETEKESPKETEKAPPAEKSEPSPPAEKSEPSPPAEKSEPSPPEETEAPPPKEPEEKPTEEITPTETQEEHVEEETKEEPTAANDDQDEEPQDLETEVA